MKLISAIAMVATISLAGCASTSTTPRGTDNTATSRTQSTDARKAANAAQVPANYRAQVVAYARDTLKDPYSIKSAEISGPREVFVGLLNGGHVPGVCVKMNAKNSFGAYIGVQALVVAFKNGSVFYASEPVFGDCDGAAYGPFLELENIT